MLEKITNAQTVYFMSIFSKSYMQVTNDWPHVLDLYGKGRVLFPLFS